MTTASKDNFDMAISLAVFDDGKLHAVRRLWRSAGIIEPATSGLCDVRC